jgi:hypothetical protein
MNGNFTLWQLVEENIERVDIALAHLRKRGTTKHLRTSFHSGLQAVQAIVDGVLDTLEECEQTVGKRTPKTSRKTTSKKITISE